MRFISSSQNQRLFAAFFGGQIVMLGIVALLRPVAAGAQAEPETVTAPGVIVRKSATGAGMQLSAEGAAGGPSLALFDATGVSRIQMSLDGKGNPTFLLRAKTGTIQMGIGLQDERPVVAVRGTDGALTPVLLQPAPPKSSPTK